MTNRQQHLCQIIYKTRYFERNWAFLQASPGLCSQSSSCRAGSCKAFPGAPPPPGAQQVKCSVTLAKGGVVSPPCGEPAGVKGTVDKVV